VKLFVVNIIFLLSSIALSQELTDRSYINIEPLRSIKKVHKKSVIEEVVKLDHSKVMIADYELLRRDFPALVHLENNQIDDWLLENFTYISKDQVSQTIVNTKIKTISNQKRKAYRPPEYGRALVYEAQFEGAKIGLMDVKGAGGIKPSHASHRSGTMTLGEALREFSYEKMVTNIVDHSGIENKVVGSYAVIDAGFDVIHPDGSKSPAGLYFRQAHRRLTEAETGRGNGWLPIKWLDRFEALFSKYGLWANYNYQGTVNNDLFDFGHYIVRDDLKASKKSLLIPFEKWGYSNPQNLEIAPGSDRWRFSKRDHPWNWSHDTALAFREGRASRHDVWMHHYHLVKPVETKLKDVPRIYEEAQNLGFKVRSCQRQYDF
jgi:hypothetical protein